MAALELRAIPRLWGFAPKNTRGEFLFELAQTGLSPCILHGSLEEHVFNKYSKSSCGVLDEDVGYGAY